MGREFALVGGQVFDTGTTGWLTGCAVHVRGARIAAVVPVAALPPESAVERLDVAGSFILPGLIDVHVHSEDWHAPLYLANGVTAVRDVGCSLAQTIARRQAWNRADACAPRFVCTGPLLDGDSGASWTGMAEIIRTPREARTQVDRLVDAGVDQIKIYAGLDRPCALAVLERAQHHGRFTVAHLQDHMHAAEAIAAGLDEIEHLSGFAEALWPERHAAGEHWLDLWPDLEPDRVRKLLDTVVESGTWLAPTRIVWKRITDAGDPRQPRHRQFAYAPDELRDWWDRLYGRPAPEAERMRRVRALAAMQIMTASLAERGARLVTGSDAPFCHVMPGFGLVDELSLLVDCGMQPRPVPARGNPRRGRGAADGGPHRQRGGRPRSRPDRRPRRSEPRHPRAARRRTGDPRRRAPGPTGAARRRQGRPDAPAAAALFRRLLSSPAAAAQS